MLERIHFSPANKNTENLADFKTSSFNVHADHRVVHHHFHLGEPS